MATRRAKGVSGRLKRAQSPNYAADTKAPKGVRRLAATYAGQAPATFLKAGSNNLLSVRTLIKRQPTDGITAPEHVDAMLTGNNVHLDRGGAGGYRGITVLSKQPVVGLRRNQKIVKTPRPAPGGVRNPYGRKPI